MDDFFHGDHACSGENLEQLKGTTEKMDFAVRDSSV